MLPEKNDNYMNSISSLLFPLILKSNDKCFLPRDYTWCIKKNSNLYYSAVVFWRLLLKDKKVQQLSFVDFCSNFKHESKLQLRDIFNRISNHDKHLTLRNCLFFVQNLNDCDKKKLTEILYNSTRGK